MTLAGGLERRKAYIKLASWLVQYKGDGREDSMAGCSELIR